MVSSPVHVSDSNDRVTMLTGDLDVSLLSPMVASLAGKDSEIGARLGICFTFTGAFACDNFVVAILLCALTLMTT